MSISVMYWSKQCVSVGCGITVGIKINGWNLSMTGFLKKWLGCLSIYQELWIQINIGVWDHSYFFFLGGGGGGERKQIFWSDWVYDTTLYREGGCGRGYPAPTVGTKTRLLVHYKVLIDIILAEMYMISCTGGGGGTIGKCTCISWMVLWMDRP